MTQQSPEMPSDPEAYLADLKQQVLDGWENGADFFDERWGDQGDEFHHGVFAPAAESMLGLEHGARVLELACGNGGFARRLGRQGIRVLATDLSPALIAHAERRTETIADQQVDVSYQVVDATVEREIVNCGGPFDAAVCIMGAMSMLSLRPMFGGVWRVLKPRGIFVLVTLHPSFATSGYKFAKSENENEPHGLTVSRYLSRYVTHGVTNTAQKEPQIYFHRPMHELLTDAFASGLVLDGMAELAAPEQPMEDSRLMWNVLPDIPMAVALRFRRP
ncbi:MAG: class I SAM-dependent methyltransferase [Chloroflexi bacterium]|nr:class I SAM-dependent methyltransferase [Chloroflexota bacterium]MCY3696953.1 class I SAM-dependent methyltransferase [Chloroflexota bacterium]